MENVVRHALTHPYVRDSPRLKEVVRTAIEPTRDGIRLSKRLEVTPVLDGTLHGLS